MKITRLYHTVKYLKPIQITSRIWKKIHHPAIPVLAAPPRRTGADDTAQWCRRRPSMPGASTFRFLNVEKTLTTRDDWQSLSSDKLWMYNLHYFDDLAADEADSRTDWHRQLIHRWIGECPPGMAVAWDPYPMSLRIVNWIKYLRRQEEPDAAVIESLATQARALRRNLEWHLLGNHLFANAKALIFAGTYFSGDEADEWLRQGSKIMQAQLSEQVLPDGGQFELSPMYHCILLEDILDLIQLDRLYPDVLPASLSTQLQDCATRMLGWLEVMTRPNSEIVQFNDAAQGIAATPDWLYAYARRLRVQWQPLPQRALIHLPDTGYVRISSGELTLFLDIAAIGPDYIPGHAHADSLNFELHLRDEPVIVDSGTSIYGISDERHRQRTTSAHNTIEIDGLSSSEVWGGFRVARRAHTTLDAMTETPQISVSAHHNGYQTIAGKSIHQRQWTVGKDKVTIEDDLPGQFNRAVARLHLHPEIKIEQTTPGRYMLTTAGNRQLSISFKNGDNRLQESSYHPEFGISSPSCCIKAVLTDTKLTTEIRVV
ncbi:MAG TPA: alginate lyase family protein [Gammaproteobacteria bacterium]|nr:alginate lyase family protein [Gammaproteobacteria bacterium]